MRRYLALGLAISLMVIQVGCSNKELAKDFLAEVAKQADLDINREQIGGIVDAVSGAMGEIESSTEKREPIVNNQIISEDSDFLIHFIDVGQADAILVMCDDQTMLVDGGNVDDSSVIAAVLESYDIEHIDYVVNTHPHEDHVGGLTAALSVATAGHVYSSMEAYDSRAFSNFVEAAQAQGLEVEMPQAGDFFSLGSSEVTILGPIYDYEDTNDTSIVMKIVYGDTSFMLTGDAEMISEKDIIDVWGEDSLESTLLKVGHHGSSSSTCYEFLRAVYPSYAVISCGVDNKYGHPHDEVMSRLDDAGVMIFRTDEEGDIIVASDGSELTIATQQY